MTHKKLTVSDEVYSMIKIKQAELISKSDQYIKLEDITNLALKFVINNIHLKSDEKSWILYIDLTKTNKLNIDTLNKNF